VYAVLHDRGLGDFYACAISPGISQRNRRADEPDRFAILDDPGTAAEFLVKLAPGQERAVFRIPDLHCASCVWLLERLWRVEPGVARTEVDLVRKVVRVDFDPSTTSLRRVAEALASVGYEPSLDSTRAVAAVAARQRNLVLKIGVAGFAFGNVMLFSVPEYLAGQPLEPPFRQIFDALNAMLAVLVLVYSASDYFRSAWRALYRRAVTLDVPVALGLAVMFARSMADVIRGTSTGFFDSFTGLVLFLLVGKLFQQKAFDAIAFDRTVRSFLPLFARVSRDGIVVARPIQEIGPGDVLLVRPNEVVPADALLDEEMATVDLAFITGESTPVTVRRGEFVRAGARVSGRALRLVVLRPASRGTLAELWAHPIFERPRSHWLTMVADRFGAWFTVAACAVAAAGAVAWWPDANMSLQVATAVLIIACPCALTLAAPITLGTAMGMLGRAGCFLKSPAVLLDLSRIDHVIFDKTGTLTAGAERFALERNGLTPPEWRAVTRLATHSTHPISRAIASSDIHTGSEGSVSGVLEVPGEGITGEVDDQVVVIGRRSFVEAVTGAPIAPVAGWTWVAVNGRVGRLRLNAAARLGVEAMLQRLGRRHTLSLVSGDHSSEVATWRPWFGRVTGDQTPSDKLLAVRAARDAGHHVLMVGDGLNDAGALAAAEVGLAVSDDTACLVPACDAVIRGDRLPGLDAILAYARRAKHVIVLCFVVSIFYNALGLTFALRGDLTPLVTAILMPVSSISIVALGAGLMRWRAPKGLPA
jgi:Cu+-exporting ATPase